MAQLFDEHAIPGTVHMLDLNHTIATKHAKGMDDLVLVPTPSNDPDDPLNWSSGRKALSTACITICTLVVGIANSVVYSIIVPLSAATDLTISDLNAGTGYLFLLCGWGLIFWQPFALQYGKRPTYLISVLATLGLTMWGPYASNNGLWITKNILGGFFAAPIEALPEISVTDVYFSHQRATYIALYAFSLSGSNFIAAVICGFINEYQGWRWAFYWPTIFLAVAFIFLFFFMEETNYKRKTVGVVEVSINSLKESSDNDTSPKPPVELTTLEVPPKKSYLQKLSLKDKPKPNHMLYRAGLGFLFLKWPVVFYAGFSYGTYLIWFNALNATASVILSAPPYNFSSSFVGLSYLSCILGVACGALFTGRFNDWLTLRLVRKNKGIMEPEQRLWSFAACVILVPGSLLLWGVGAAHEIHWFGLIFAMFALSFANTCGVTLSCNYMIDSYKELSGEAITAVILIRNTMSFAISYGITPWLDGMGTQNCFISAAFIGMVISTAFLVMIARGKQFRQKSGVAYWTLVRKNIDMDLVEH